jgi:hypothetical protein
MTVSELYQLFSSPDARYRGKPFWAWNGKLEKDELLRQVHVMHQMGFGGFFMHSRVGLATEYLGDEWFDLINACADEAGKLGMEAWLYDEDRWPSGTAGGMVTCEPRFRLKFLRCRPVPGSEFAWQPELIAAFACDLDGLTCTNCSRLQPNTPAEQYRDRTVLAFTTEESYPSSFYNGYTYVDALNREATDRFLEVTHERYRQRCGDRLGTSIKGIFTDEPHRGTLMGSFSVDNPDPQWLAPWTYTLFDRFQQDFGYDLRDHLPELFLWPEGERVSPVKWHFVELLQRMFLDNFAAPINEWCERNGLILTGHVLHEDALSCQTAMCGSLMRFYEHMGYPGVDVLSEGNRAFWIVKQLSSAARQLGQKWLLSELYGCTGWQMPLEAHKSVGDWQALFGINLRCPHLSWFTMEGEAKRDYPASILHQSTWWEDYDFVETYFSRIGVLMTEGSPVCDLLVVNPIESLWCQIHPGWCSGLASATEPLKELEQAYSDLFHWLCGAQIDFDYGDEEMLSRLCSVETDEDGAALLRVGQATYRAVLVGKMTTLRSSTLKLLADFHQAGGQVLFAGDPPAYLDALPSEEPGRLAREAQQLLFTQEAVVAALSSALPAAVQLSPVGDSDVSSLYCQVRRDADFGVVMLLNADREQGRRCRVQIRHDGALEEWDCATGRRQAVVATRDGDWLSFETDFAPSGERLYVLLAEADPSVQPLPAREVVSTQIVTGPFDYRLSEPNVCVLDLAAWRVDDQPWQPQTEILKIDRAVRKHFGCDLRGGHMLQPWFTAGKDKPVLGRVSLRFELQVDELPQGPVELVLEHPEHFSLSVNGKPLCSDSPRGWWIDCALQRLVLPESVLQVGGNTIEVGVDFHEGIDLEALYLLGNFGVKLSGSRQTLTKLPRKLGLGDLGDQGLPFYSGVVTYLVPAPKVEAGDRVVLEVPQFSAACLRVTGKDESPLRIAWRPYEAEVTDLLAGQDHLALDLVLTRRNTFGPLHQLPLRAGSYGPGSFTTEGQGFSQDYVLWPGGLLGELHWRLEH